LEVDRVCGIQRRLGHRGVGWVIEGWSGRIHPQLKKKRNTTTDHEQSGF
jgi:hypothetical protein